MGAGNGFVNFIEASMAITNHIMGYHSLLRPHQNNGGLTPDESKRLFWKTLKPWPVFVDHYTIFAVKMEQLGHQAKAEQMERIVSENADLDYAYDHMKRWRDCTTNKQRCMAVT